MLERGARDNKPFTRRGRLSPCQLPDVGEIFHHTSITFLSTTPSSGPVWSTLMYGGVVVAPAVCVYVCREKELCVCVCVWSGARLYQNNKQTNTEASVVSFHRYQNALVRIAA